MEAETRAPATTMVSSSSVLVRTTQESSRRVSVGVCAFRISVCFVCTGACTVACPILPVCPSLADECGKGEEMM